MAKNKVLSIILLSYHSGERINVVYEKISQIFLQNKIPFELIIVDDGSTDHSFEIGKALEKNQPYVRAIQLSRNYTSHYAAFAGLSVAKGGCCTMIPDDEQQPYTSIVEMYRLWEAGNKVIIPYRNNREDSFFSRLWSQLFYKIFNSIADVKFPYGGADSFFVDREIIDVINKHISPRRTTTITEVLRLGFDPIYLAYNRKRGNNKKSRWTWRKKLNLAKDLLYSSSSWPIKLIINMGLIWFLFSISLVLLLIYVRFFGNNSFWHLRDFPGWTSTVVIVSFFSGLILLSLGIIAEYIYRIFEEVKHRPGFLIKSESLKNPSDNAD
jgi:glycosyltransferase involved in cell wall biosynthesis